jgi:uncharacterized protein YndB with AHSA1/START domain
MLRLALGILASLVCASTTRADVPSSLMDGKSQTDRAVLLETVVAARPPDVFRLFASEDGVRKFFAPDARIEPRLGGHYTIIFNPATDPEGAASGTKGARILRFEPDRELAFEWNVAVPSIAADLKSDELPTWVELRFESLPGPTPRTRVALSHYGFRSGGSWDKAFPWFRDKAWPSVLEALKKYCDQGRPKDWTHQ